MPDGVAITEQQQQQRPKSDGCASKYMYRLRTMADAYREHHHRKVERARGHAEFLIVDHVVVDGGDEPGRAEAEEDVDGVGAGHVS